MPERRNILVEDEGKDGRRKPGQQQGFWCCTNNYLVLTKNLRQSLRPGPYALQFSPFLNIGSLQEAQFTSGATAYSFSLSFVSFEISATMNSLDLAGDAAGASSLWKPTAAEQKAYGHLFSLADADHKGIVQGQAAVPFFQKSGLSDAVLGRVWQFADTKSKGHLTSAEFSVAMKLISLAQAKKPVALANLKDETPLPALRGIDMPHDDEDDALTQFTHQRRSSAASSVGWGSMMGQNEAAVPDVEKQQYTRIFNANHPVDGVIDGMTARGILMRSKVSVEQLSKLWTLVDPKGEGKMRLPGFIVAMYYIRRIMENKGFMLPATCPASLWQSAGGDPLPRRQQQLSDVFGSMNSSTPDLGKAVWDVTSEEKEKRGFLAGDAAVNFFLKSKLSEALLAKVWDLADIGKTGKLNKDQFAVAMHLINGKLAGRDIPDTLPATLVPPSMRKASVASPSLRNLSPTMRPLSADRQQQALDPLRRSTTMSVGRQAARRRPGRRQLTSEIAQMQSQVSHLEDFSRGLQTQRNTIASNVAAASARKQELEIKISALQSSHEAEAKINNELEEKLRSEEARSTHCRRKLGEANKTLAIVVAQKTQLQRDVQAVQAQQAEVQAQLRQAQEEAQRLSAEISALDREKKHLEQTLAVAQSQAKQQQEANAVAQQSLAAAKSERLGTREPAAIEQPVPRDALLQQAAVPSFDDIFGASDVHANSPGPDAFGDMFKSPPPQPLGTAIDEPSNAADSFENFATSVGFVPTSTASGPSGSQALPPARSIAETSAAFSSSDAFDSFGAQSMDPFEEFLQSTVTSEPAAAKSGSPPSVRSASFVTPQPTSPVVPERPKETVPPANDDFDAIFGESQADLPATTNGTAAAAVISRAASVPPTSTAITPDVVRSNVSSPFTAATPKSAGNAFDVDFSGAFGEMRGSSDKAIAQELESFNNKFPDIGDVSQKPSGKDNLTFESLFGPGEETAVPEKTAGEPAKAAATAATAGLQTIAEEVVDTKKPEAESKPKDDDKDFVPPPVVKRTNGMN
ncbi:hypothetical protein DL89DRAFT_255636 [Linderina pennispora]|uniref:EF-hand n=1 Tax=Linderina pennispora TaxID=61395 RepID=A0A1Y1WFJ2_9FUNG|nr:uncharacterized protein DL89DRAFT_255636 [Linderina pennispora]ORX71924.1 hypothetical protein DL89DRAFT_255636 [Linderina pennispora]